MKQVLQSLRDGGVEVADVPAPGARRGELRIATTRTLISSGTERMMIDFGRGSWLDKARQQPDKVKMVLAKARTDGLVATYEAVRSKLGQPLAPGYCNVGRVLAAGAGVEGFAAGDRVVSNGKHAETVGVPANLCARIPDGVADEHAAFTVVAAIGLQGIRLVQPTLGETVIVTGLGLIGLLTVQMLRAHGCRVLGLDFDPAKLELARRFGAEVVDLSGGADPVAAAERFTRGRGVDAVIITAATRSSEPVHQAALMCRKRGRIVLVGVTGLELSRADFYEKELTFQVSCSYGPGRYDPDYEEKGFDYPIGFVRWTEQRNFEAVLDMLADGRLEVASLISHRFAVTEAARAYDVVAGSEPSLGILLQYDDEDAARREARAVPVTAPAATPGAGRINVVGAGSYASAVLMPAFKAAGARLRAVASAGGASAVHLARKFGFETASTDAAALIADAEADAVVIATRHDSHAALVEQALRAGKHVFVEKPLALTHEELARIEAACGDRLLMVGFNRRFSPLVLKAKALLGAAPGPKSLVMTVNAGAIPANHWTQDPDVGGGRLLGEGCHFIDLLRHLAGAPIVAHRVSPMQSATRDTATVTLEFADGSIGTLHYFANGSKAVSKERLEVFASGRVLQLDNFLRLRAHGWGSGDLRLWRQDKGQRECARRFVQAIVQGGPAPIAREELFEVGRVCIDVQRALAG